MNFAHPHFAAPGWLLLAVLGPIAFALLCGYAARARARQLNALAEPEAQARLLIAHSPGRRRVKQVIIALVLVVTGLALARPQWGFLMQTTDLQGEDIMVVLDCSKSMLTTDVRPNRLTRAQLGILDFVQSRPGGRVGLVAFAGQAFVQCPLTFDYDAFRECLMAIDEKTIPVQGTDLARALDEASKAMEADARRKVLVLVTDGEDLEKAGIDKAKELAKAGVVVHAIGVGTRDGKPLQVADKGTVDYLRDAKGVVVTSRLDENTLRGISRVTGGTYQPLGATGQGLIHLREVLETATAGPGRIDSQSYGVDRFYWFIALGLLLIIAESVIGTRRRMSENSQT